MPPWHADILDILDSVRVPFSLCLASIDNAPFYYCFVGAIAYTDGRFGEGVSQILLDQVNCTGSELSLFACQNIRRIGLTCPQTSSAGIQCNPTRN